MPRCSQKSNQEFLVFFIETFPSLMLVLDQKLVMFVKKISVLFHETHDLYRNFVLYNIKVVEEVMHSVKPEYNNMLQNDEAYLESSGFE